MNQLHRFFRFPSFAVAVVALACVAVSLAASPVRAQLAGTTHVQSSLPPPPAFAMAKRLAAAHDYAGAIKKLNDVVSSAMYRNTPYAPEAVYSIVHIYEDDLHDDYDAITQLNLLVNNYTNVSYHYPHEPLVLAERNALGIRVDAENRAAALKGVTDWSLRGVWDAALATGYVVVDFFIRLTGDRNYSYWVALLLISVIVRVILWPLSVKQYKSMKEMQRLQPLIKDLQAKYKNDKQTLQAKQLELYKEHNVNPAAGCLPMLMQFPFFIYMYHAVWLYQFRFSHGTFLWICPAIHKLAPGFIGANLADQDIPLLALYAISMYVTQRMMPATDPQQAEMQKSTALMSSALFFFLFQNYHFPSAFVLYWFFSNIVSSAVQMYVMRRGSFMTAPALVAPPPGDGDATELKPSDVKAKPLAEKNGKPSGASNNGATPSPTARGVIAPKVHPKKKRR